MKEAMITNVMGKTSFTRFIIPLIKRKLYLFCADKTNLYHLSSLTNNAISPLYNKGKEKR